MAPKKKTTFSTDSAVKSHDVKSKQISKKAAPQASALKKKAAKPAEEKKAKTAGVALAQKQIEEDKEIPDDVSSDSDEDFDEDGMAGSSGSDIDDDEDGLEITEEAKPSDRTSMRPYRALYLRHLPVQFQEPELRKFLRQFGATVVGCFVVRNKKSFSSRGSAYVRFAANAGDEIYDAIMEECHGMLLGGNTVTCKWVTLQKPLPMRKNVNKMMRKDWANRVKGVKLTRRDTKAKNYVAQLMSAAKTEKASNKFLASVGIKYEFTGFADQMARVDSDAIKTYHESCQLQAKAKKDKKSKRAAQKAEVAAGKKVSGKKGATKKE